MDLFIKTKLQLRRIFREKRNNLNVDVHSEANEAILQNVLQIINSLSIDNNIGIYWPLQGEPDISKLLILFHSQISLPKIKNQELSFIKYQIGDKIIKAGTADLYHPVSNSEIIPNIIILPGIAFDLKGYRIGFGSGHYDKYLSALKLKKITTIGVCFHEFLIEDTLPEPHDQKMDFIVTNKIILKT